MKGKEKIIKLLKKNPKGLFIGELATKARLSRVTVRLILSELLVKKKIHVRAVGNAKMHYWRSKK